MLRRNEFQTRGAEKRKAREQNDSRLRKIALNRRSFQIRINEMKRLQQISRNVTEVSSCSVCTRNM